VQPPVCLAQKVGTVLAGSRVLQRRLPEEKGIRIYRMKGLAGLRIGIHQVKGLAEWIRIWAGMRL
jgi:hypothetical protein